MAASDDLASVKNLGPALAGDLRAVGIHDARELAAVGAGSAWERLYDAGLRDDLQSRLALEGAVEGRRWVRLDETVRARCAEHVRARTARPG